MNKTTRGFLGIYIVLMITLLFLFIKYVIIARHKQIAALIPVTYESEIPPSLIDELQNRGGIEFNDSLVISSYLLVIEEPENFNDWDDRGGKGRVFPIIRHQIADLPPPYILWKAANNDTVYVRKNDTLNFKFLLNE